MAGMVGTPQAKPLLRSNEVWFGNPGLRGGSRWAVNADKSLSIMCGSWLCVNSPSARVNTMPALANRKKAIMERQTELLMAVEEMILKSAVDEQCGRCPAESFERDARWSQDTSGVQLNFAVLNSKQ
jgi:hypothetical protein